MKVKTKVKRVPDVKSARGITCKVYKGTRRSYKAEFRKVDSRSKVK